MALSPIMSIPPSVEASPSFIRCHRGYDWLIWFSTSVLQTISEVRYYARRMQPCTKISYSLLIKVVSPSTALHNVVSRFCSSYFKVKLELWRSKAYALSPSLSLSPSDSGTQAPLGAGFGNPFASGVGTNLGSSSLGGTTSVRLFHHASS